MTPTQLAEIEAWVAQVDAAAARIDTGTAAAVLATYAAIEDWENPTQTLPAAAAAAAAAAAGRQAAAEPGAQLVAGVVSILRDVATGLSGARSVVTVPYSRQADPFDVYSRPIHVYRDAIARGVDQHSAQTEAFARAEMLAFTDNLLARRDAAIAQLERESVTHYRRVIRPELSKTGTCGLCIAAASRVYTRSDLMPIHTRCKCDVIPIVGGSEDPGEALNLADMKQLYDGMDATRKEDLIRFRYAVDETGELGPILTPAATATSAVGPGAAGPASGFENQSSDWLRQQIAITESLKDSDWRTSQLARLRGQLARNAA